jgi:hypothetical protein
MTTWLPLWDKDLDARLEQLSDNPLFASLLMLSPPDAFEYMGLGVVGALFENLRPAAPEQTRQVRQIVKALEAGHTSLDGAQVVQPGEQPAAVLRLIPGSLPVRHSPLSKPFVSRPPASSPETTTFTSDITLAVSESTLQFFVARYVQTNFQEAFSMMTKKGLEVRLKVEEVSFELVPHRVHLVARLQGDFALKVRGLTLANWHAPIEVDMLTGFSLNDAGQLCADIGKGEIRVLKAPLPFDLANTLVQKIVRAAPAIPLLNISTIVPDTQGYLEGEVILMLSEVRVDDGTVRLDFRVFHGTQGVEVGAP